MRSLPSAVLASVVAVRGVYCALALVSVVAAQATENVVRLPTTHLLRAEQTAELPRLTPVDGSPPMLALGTANPGLPDSRLLDLVAAALNTRGGKRAKVRFEDAGLRASCQGLDATSIRNALLDGIDCLVPAITLDVSVYGPTPSPPPVVLAPESDSSLPKKALHTRSLECACAQTATIHFGDGDGDGHGSHLRLRLQPHLLPGREPRIALLCAFESEHRGRSGVRRWTAGTASAAVSPGGRVVVTLPGRVIAVRARHKPRPMGTRRRIGISWSLLTTTSLRTTASLGKAGPGLLQHKRLPAAGDSDTLLAYFRDHALPAERDGTLSAYGIGPRMLLYSTKPKVLSEARRTVQEALSELLKPWTETARVDCTITGSHGVAIVRLPTMPGRSCVLFHSDTARTKTTGAVFALNWHPDVKGLANPAHLRVHGHGEVTGFAVPLTGEATPSGNVTPIKVGGASKPGATHLVESDAIQLKISRR